MEKIPFRISDIEVGNFKLESDTNLKDDKVDVSTTLSFAVNKEARLVKSTIDYAYSQDGASLLAMTLSCVFAVHEGAFDDMLDGGKFTMKPFFSQYLATINVGAARGEIHARCEMAHSRLAKVVLPPINLAEALAEPVVIEMK